MIRATTIDDAERHLGQQFIAFTLWVLEEAAGVRVEQELTALNLRISDERIASRVRESSL
jgi:hypothetical protein